MTDNTHRQVPAIQRYKIGYHSDEWGVRSSTPGGISDPSGQWVLYKDYIAALVEAQQPAPSGAVALSDYLRDRLVAISEAIADQDDRAAQAMLREILAAPQPWQNGYHVTAYTTESEADQQAAEERIGRAIKVELCDTKDDLCL